MVKIECQRFVSIILSRTFGRRTDSCSQKQFVSVSFVFSWDF